MTVKAPEAPEAPATLGEPGRRFWEIVVERFILEPHHVDVLEQAARALDRAEACRARIEADGLVLVDRFGQEKAHPLLAAERDARSQFRQFYRELSLDEDEPKQLGRPPAWTV